MEKRIPRPLGMTSLMVEFHQCTKAGEKDIKFKLAIDYMIHQWFVGNGLLCGESLNINNLSQILNVDPDYISVYMRERLSASRVWDSSNQKQLLEGLLGLHMTWVLEDRQEASSQVDILKRDQGGKYVPFLTGELRQAMDQKMKANNNLQSMLRMFQGGGGSITNIFMGPTDNTAELEEDKLSYEDAVEIISKDSNSLVLMEQEKLDQLGESYNIAALPEVCARDQVNFNADKEGLKLVKNKAELAEVIDDYQIHTRKDKQEEYKDEEDFHNIRRELDMEIDEEDDPELNFD